MTPQIVEEVLGKALVGKDCWYVACGGCTGSVIALYIGAAVPRSEPLNNKAHPLFVQYHNSEYRLMVWCPWRLVGSAGPITGAGEPSTLDGPMVRGIARVEHQTIVGVRVDEFTLDLRVTFSSDLELTLFCDTTELSSVTSDWILFRPDGAPISSNRAAVRVGDTT